MVLILLQYIHSLHDSHCRHLYLNNHKLREHLVNLGLITVDLKIVASTQQQRQKIRAHEMLERRELLLTKMNQKQNQRLSNLEVNSNLSYMYVHEQLKALFCAGLCRYLCNYLRFFLGAFQGKRRERKDN